MKLSLLISSGTWELVDRLRPHLDVCIDLFDSDLNPLLPESRDEISRLVRRLPSTHATPGSTFSEADRFRAALQTATTQFFTVQDCRVGLFPLRQGRRVVGILLTAERSAAAETDPQGEAAASGDGPPLLPFGSLPAAPPLGPRAPVAGWSPDATDSSMAGSQLERLGWSLRATIESDIETHVRLEGEQQQSRWLSTTLRFLEHLHTGDTEADLTQALVQAAAIWGDLDARLYRRTIEGTFVLHSALPSLIEGLQPRTIPGGLVSSTSRPARLTSIAELEGLGWSGPQAEVLFVPLGDGEHEWLLAVGGQVDDRFQRVLMVAANTLALRLDQLAARTTANMVSAIAARLIDTGSTWTDRLAAALSDILLALGARGACIVSRDGQTGSTQVVASAGRDQRIDRWPGASTATCLVRPVAVAGQRQMSLQVVTSPDRPFPASAKALVSHGAAVLGPWLLASDRVTEHQVVTGFYGPERFVARIEEELERAKRCEWPASLLVLREAGPLTPDGASQRHRLLRQCVRRSDVVGLLPGNTLTALLMQTDSVGAGKVVSRVEAALLEQGRDMEAAVPSVSSVTYPIDGETAQALTDAVARQAPPAPAPA